MNTWLWSLGQNTITVALMLPLVLLACRLFRNRPAAQHVLWVIVLLKFVTPPIVSWPWTVEQMGEAIWTTPAPGSGEQAAAPLPAPERSGPSNVTGGPHPDPDPGSAKMSVDANPTASTIAKPSEPGDTPISEPQTTGTYFPVQAIAGAWLLGAILCGVLQLRRIARHAAFVRRGTTAPAQLTTEVKAAAQRLGMSPPRAVLARGIVSPFVWCLGYLRLVWPESLGNATAIARSRGIIAHELAHVRRCDHWVAWIELIAGIICWWNPLYWYVHRRLRETAEMACDALAIASNPGNRREYAEMLLEISAGFKNGAPAPVLAVGAVTPSSFERRLNMILSHRVSGKMSSFGILAAIGFALLALPHWSLGQPAPLPDQNSEVQSDRPPAAEEPVRANEQLHNTLLTLDKQLWDAAKTGDWKVYDRLVAEDWVGYSARYGRSDKAATVENVKKRRYSDWTIRDVKTKVVSKDVVILTYVYNCKVTSVADGTVEEYRDHQTSQIWSHREGAWVLVFCQETDGSKAAHPPIASEESPVTQIGVKSPQKQDKEQDKDAFTAWGKEVGGLQAGLGYRPGEKRVYYHGETATLVVRVRNVGKEPIKFEYLRQFFIENPPTVTDGKDELNQLGKITALGIHIPVEVNLAAGKEIELYELKLYLGSGNEEGIPKYPYIFGTGKFQVQYEKVLGNSSSGTIKIDPALDKLATGKLELEVKEPEKLSQEKEAFTAWGKEVGGLQAGLGFRPGEQRAYSHGEAVAVVLRVRNVGKEPVEFKHIWAFFLENPPTITDADGKVVQLLRPKPLGLHGPRSTNVAPGKEVELFEWEFDLRPKEEGSKKEWATIRGVGKFSLQCERVVGPTSANPNHPNPALGKLATGKLELEVKDAEKLPEQGDQKKEDVTAWGKEVGRGLHKGKEVGGLQAGLGFRPGQKRAYSHGETVTLVVRIRNVGKDEVTFDYIPAYFFDRPPSVTDREGKAAPQIRLPTDGHEGEYNPKELTLAPGKEVELAEVKLELRPASESGNKKVNTLYGTGKFQIHYERLMYRSGRRDIGSILSNLATGKLELDIKAGERGLTPQTQEQKQEKEGFTAWGKEFGGLQAGLGFTVPKHDSMNALS